MKPKGGIALHWWRLKRSLKRRFLEFRLPYGFERLGTRYGGWWINTKSISDSPLLIDCGLGEDISFPVEFLKRFPGAHIIGVEPNPRSLSYCYKNCPKNMDIIEKAFWTSNNKKLSFHLPRLSEELPSGADGVSGSVHKSHEYVNGGDTLEVLTTDLPSILSQVGRDKCDILKMDIEGAEYEVIDNLSKSCLLHKVNQLLVEYHHGVTQYTIQNTKDSVSQVISCGFELVHTEGRNYIFHRK